MKNIYLTALLITCSCCARAQFYYGLQGGGAVNLLLTNISNRPQQVYRPGYGFFAAIPVQYQWHLNHSSELGISTEVSFIQKSYALDQTDKSLSALNQHTRNGYLQVPVSANYFYSIKKIKLFVSGGVYGAYWLDSHIKGAFANLINTAAPSPQAYSYSEKYTFNNETDNRDEWGWQAGGGAFYKLLKGYSTFVKVDFFQSMSNQQKQYMLEQIPRYNSTYVLSVGILKKLGHG